MGVRDSNSVQLHHRGLADLQPSTKWLILSSVRAESVRHAVIQRKLDYRDETINTLEREQAAAGDDDVHGDVEEAKEVLQMAREAYSRGELQLAWLLAERATIGYPFWDASTLRIGPG